MDREDVRVEFVVERASANSSFRWEGKGYIYFPGVNRSVFAYPELTELGSTRWGVSWSLKRKARKAVAKYRREKSGKTSDRRWEETF